MLVARLLEGIDASSERRDELERTETIGVAPGKHLNAPIVEADLGGGVPMAKKVLQRARGNRLSRQRLKFR